MDHEPEVGEWIRVHWDNEHGHHTDLGFCTGIEKADGFSQPATWYAIQFPDGRIIHYESYNLEEIGLLEKIAVAADERYAGRIGVVEASMKPAPWKLYIAWFEHEGEKIDHPLRAASLEAAEKEARKLAEDKGLKFLRVEEDQ